MLVAVLLCMYILVNKTGVVPVYKYGTTHVLFTSTDQSNQTSGAQLDLSQLFLGASAPNMHCWRPAGWKIPGV